MLKKPRRRTSRFLFWSSFQLFGFSSRIKPPKEYYEVNRKVIYYNLPGELAKRIYQILLLMSSFFFC